MWLITSLVNTGELASREGGIKMWQDEWPTEKGLWWLYGWCFGKEGIREDNKPELCLVRVSGPLGSGGFMYVTNGHFLYKEEGATGKWQKAVIPDLP